MSGFSFVKNKVNNSNIPEVGVALIGKSTTIHAGDVLIRTTASARNGVGGSGPAVIRPLFSGDTVTSSNGLFGVSMCDLSTDANGNLTTVPSIVSVDTRGKLDLYNMWANILPLDPASNFLQIPVILFTPDNVFQANAKNTEIVSFYDLGRPIGIFCSNSGSPSSYQVTATNAAANAPLVCDSVNTEDPLYNSSASGIGATMNVFCAQAFFQGWNQNNWTS